MTVFFLVRHAAHGRLGRFLDGRRAGVHLDDTGRGQADRLAARLAHEKVDAVYASPIARAQETAAPIAAAVGCAMQTSDALDEIDFGDWSGQTFEALAPRPDWQRWNSARSTARTPAGATMRAVQARMLAFMDDCRTQAPDGSFVLVGHCDPIKAAVAFHLGTSLDNLARIAIAPASVSRLDIDDWGACVMYLNETVS